MSSNNSVSIGYTSLHYVCLKVNEVYFNIHIYVFLTAAMLHIVRVRVSVCCFVAKFCQMKFVDLKCRGIFTLHLHFGLLVTTYCLFGYER